jgi:hypothetical protein
MFGLALLLATHVPAITKVLVTKVGIAIIVVLVTVLLVMAFTA